MLRIGLIGLGFMGRTHLENYLRLEKEGTPIRVVALCDMDPAKLQGKVVGGNIDTTTENTIDFERFNKYASLDEMLAVEELDCIDITLPTYLHKEVTIQCLKHGLHVLCEKPMALYADECEAMIKQAKESGKQLMIGQCLRFWPAYEYLKNVVESKAYGEALAGYFYRGSGTPTWGPWLLQKEKSGGALLDMHVHDTDVVNWLFGKPSAVSCHAKNVIPGSGYDIVSTHYKYDDGKVINAQTDWTLQGDYGFEMNFRVNFAQGNLNFSGGSLQVNPSDAPGFKPELSEDQGYYFQLKYFVETLLAEEQLNRATPESTQGTIEIIEAELESADNAGAWVSVK